MPVYALIKTQDNTLARPPEFFEEAPQQLPEAKGLKWLPYEDTPPTYDEETQYINPTGYTITESSVARNYETINYTQEELSKRAMVDYCQGINFFTVSRLQFHWALRSKTGWVIPNTSTPVYNAVDQYLTVLAGTEGISEEELRATEVWFQGVEIGALNPRTRGMTESFGLTREQYVELFNLAGTEAA
jgi:hypothetical protein